MWDTQLVSKILNTDIKQTWSATGVSNDTRTLKPGEIYVALKGPNFDGHEFVEAAWKAKAAAAIVDHHVADVPESFCQIVVPDVLQALEKLGMQARKRSLAKIVALTGSVGKTTSKEALKYVLQEQTPTYVTPRSFNNHWGVPLTLANLPEEAKYAIIELGMNNRGEIATSTNMVKSHIAYITNVEGVHIGKLGSLENIAKAKAEIFQGLMPNGLAIINGLSNYSNLLIEEAKRCKAAEIWTIGSDSQSTICLKNVETTVDGQIVEGRILDKKISFEIGLKGEHWPVNLLGVLAIVRALGADVEKAAEKLKTFKAIPGRGQTHLVELLHGGALTVIDESYNAGPISMKAALSVLSQTYPAGNGRRIAVLGDMLELDKDSEKEHKNLAELIKIYGIDLVYTSGEAMSLLAKVLPSNQLVAHENDPEKLAKIVVENIQSGDVYMIKGSRGRYHKNGRMYSVVEALLALDRNGVKESHVV